MGQGGLADSGGFVTVAAGFGDRQSPWQRLVKRMTRFFTKLDADGSYRALQEACEKMGYGWKKSCTNQVGFGGHRGVVGHTLPSPAASGDNWGTPHLIRGRFAGHHLDHGQEEQQTHLQGEPGGDGEQDLSGFSPLQGEQRGLGWGQGVMQNRVRWVQDHVRRWCGTIQAQDYARWVQGDAGPREVGAGPREVGAG